MLLTQHRLHLLLASSRERGGLDRTLKIQHDFTRQPIRLDRKGGEHCIGGSAYIVTGDCLCFETMGMDGLVVMAKSYSSCELSLDGTRRARIRPWFDESGCVWHARLLLDHR